MLVIRAGNHKNLVRIANREYPNYTASSDLILVCAVRLGLFGRQLVFEILGHLPYSSFANNLEPDQV